LHEREERERRQEDESGVQEVAADRDPARDLAVILLDSLVVEDLQDGVDADGLPDREGIQ